MTNKKGKSYKKKSPNSITHRKKLNLYNLICEKQNFPNWISTPASAQTLVWNPNDVFNVQNYFDFDSPEKPGSDAIRMQYYPSFTSTAEIAPGLEYNNALTLAGYYRHYISSNAFNIQFERDKVSNRR